MSDNSINYKEMLSVDKWNLDKEWMQQAENYQTLSEISARAFTALTALKDKFSVEKAKVELDYRNGKNLPKDKKDIKITEKSIEALLAGNSILIELKCDINDAKANYDICSGALYAMDHKKKALEKLVTLYVSGYSAEPREAKGESGLSSYRSDGQRAQLTADERREKRRLAREKKTKDKEEN